MTSATFLEQHIASQMLAARAGVGLAAYGNSRGTFGVGSVSAIHGVEGLPPASPADQLAWSVLTAISAKDMINGTDANSRLYYELIQKALHSQDPPLDPKIAAIANEAINRWFSDSKSFAQWWSGVLKTGFDGKPITAWLTLHPGVVAANPQGSVRDRINQAAAVAYMFADMASLGLPDQGDPFFSVFPQESWESLGARAAEAIAMQIWLDKPQPGAFIFIFGAIWQRLTPGPESGHAWPANIKNTSYYKQFYNALDNIQKAMHDPDFYFGEKNPATVADEFFALFALVRF
ncbi:MAG: hypothetical protein RL235_484 [Chlamydiota bacterium]|jgi:hypothetical protein